MKLLGRIVRLQVQRSSLTVGDGRDRRYDPSALVSVDRLLLTPGGAVGTLADGTRVMDVHHADHPRSRHRGGKNGLSFNVTSHYREIGAKFGGGLRLFEGCAGENVLVDAAVRVTPGDVDRGLVIGRARLVRVSVAHPCAPFGRYVSATSDPEELKETLRFLDGGTRGFYAALEGREAVEIPLGAEVRIAD